MFALGAALAEHTLDSIGDLVRELRRLGATVEERAEGLTIHPMPLVGASLGTYDDHRMAMSLALAGLRVAGVAIADPGCVAKTFPDYWRQLATLTGFSDPGSG
jgi:3-phosphoshikimate 1-carboxyvinyltransferase